MSKIYAQHFPVLASCISGCLVDSASFSASLVCNGYSKVIGFIRTDAASLAAASGFMVRQSMDYGKNWDYVAACDTLAVNGSAACSIEIIGNAVQLWVHNGDVASSAFRTLWQLRPI